jgi:hypothetical protein
MSYPRAYAASRSPWIAVIGSRFPVLSGGPDEVYQPMLVFALARKNQK